MENNQQNTKQASDVNHGTSPSPENQQPGKQASKENEQGVANRFAETVHDDNDQAARGSESPQNETLGTP